jgi:N-methylhydantoinase A
MRYVGQEHAVTVELPHDVFTRRDRDAFKRHFDAVHERRYGYASASEKAEIVSLRSAVRGVMRKPALERIAAGDADAGAARRGTRPVFFADAGGFVPTAAFDRRALVAGNGIEGPALIEEYASTTVLHPGDVMTVDDFGNLVIDVKRA